MLEFTINLDQTAARLYQRVAEVTGRPVEAVLSDALFRLAGELSLEAIQKTASCESRTAYPPVM
ncbi:MAG: hypothetical protein ACI3V3_00740 [Faecousia sp.]